MVLDWFNRQSASVQFTFMRPLLRLFPSPSRESLPPQSPFLAASGSFAMENLSKEWNKPIPTRLSLPRMTAPCDAILGVRPGFGKLGA